MDKLKLGFDSLNTWEVLKKQIELIGKLSGDEKTQKMQIESTLNTLERLRKEKA